MTDADRELAWRVATEATVVVFGTTKGFWAKTFWFLAFSTACDELRKEK